jgi:hypothetical protein
MHGGGTAIHSGGTRHGSGHSAARHSAAVSRSHNHHHHRHHRVVRRFFFDGGSYAYDYNACFQRRWVSTEWGWQVRWVNVCY